MNSYIYSYIPAFRLNCYKNCYKFYALKSAWLSGLSAFLKRNSAIKYLAYLIHAVTLMVR